MSEQYKADKDEKEALEKYFLQFLNLEKRFPLLPGIHNPKTMADLVGLDEDEFKKLRDTFDQNARQAANELLKNDEVLAWVDQLPFEKNDTIVVLGDSFSDDRQGWFEILRNVLELTIPENEMTLINSGVSSDTSSDALKRLNRDVLDYEPDWVIAELGTFDAQKLYVSPERCLVSLADFWENLNDVERNVKAVTSNPLIWITPPPVLTEMMQQAPIFEFSIYESDLSQYREVISTKTGYIVDPSGERMGGHPPDAWNYLGDGVNPSVAGHISTVREFLKTLAESEEEVEGSKMPGMSEDDSENEEDE